jgi:hypothetical protein
MWNVLWQLIVTSNYQCETMDSATETNPSDIPHVLTAREEKKVKRSIAREATVAEKQVTQAGKARKSAENDEEKAEKVCVPIQVTSFLCIFMQLNRRREKHSRSAIRWSRRSAVLRRHSTMPSTSMTSLSQTNTRQRMTFPCVSSS